MTYKLFVYHGRHFMDTIMDNLKLTRADYDTLPADGILPCPECGGSQLYSGMLCLCPQGFGQVTHINLWHHLCPDKWVRNHDEFIKEVEAVGVAAVTAQGLWDELTAETKRDFQVNGFLRDALRHAVLIWLNGRGFRIVTNPDKPI